MDKTGKILVASQPGLKDMDFSDLLKNEKKIEKKENAMWKEIEEGKNGIFSFHSEKGVTYYVSYAIEENYDWVMAAIMPTSLFTGFSDGYVRLMIGCILAVLFIFSVFLALLYRSYFRNGRELERLAFRDEITGGINRTELRMRYQELSREKKADQYTLILLDCVDFKTINASLGDKTGDKMLRYFYTVFQSYLEKDEIVARTEMDHYYILMKEKIRRLFPCASARCLPGSFLLKIQIFRDVMWSFVWEPARWRTMIPISPFFRTEPSQW